ncbi:uncharacterized protein [Halyomorpha halys]|uniref:uncharacterized protein n=1 Tax=Halyomorpha halys TaxID=286706 RepID=UPI0006D50946|nr:uncharacterized protein LOC106684092 [Halyomorpha halys]XP_014281450.1 uncharacterized protein LOC106684092 [Halyomorpha halys]XP_014281451.1 uncharacterized protein LOC106684092 [Halyomorpha halys]XP_014281452.1 uncharacterized protein LOC106684092 [Halyomorpha halys]XP_014281453.1 uncharacterized protein LOC106684092 [Halyomorpha halys]XP_014281455.1 uncharacterized protein LOC106684092 [Halyomorpha halys]
MVDFLGYNSPYRKRESTSSRLSANLSRASKPLRKIEPGLERLNIVLRQRNRETPPPVMGKETKFSKYSPLPAIKPRTKPKLLREKTYDVLEPIYVKGPPQEEKMKLPEIKKAGGSGKTSLISGSPRRATSRGGQLVTPKRNKTMAPETLPTKLRQAFNPNNVATNSDVPNNVFWFPL